MRSKQVNFYTTPNDERHLIDQIGHKMEFICMPSISQVEHGVKTSYESIVKTENYNIYLLDESRLSDIKFLSAKERGIYYVDQLRSPAVQFSRCYCKDNIIRRGRFYFVTGYFDGDTLVKKDKEFISLGNSILKVTKNYLHLDKSTGDYYGGEALDLKSLGKTIFTFM
jgi:hypothetical protein